MGESKPKAGGRIPQACMSLSHHDLLWSHVVPVAFHLIYVLTKSIADELLLRVIIIVGESTVNGT